MPRLFHVSDTHLGFQAYTRVNRDGLNQREVDTQDAFRRVVDAALAERPDLVLHTGDLFDFPRPNNRAIVFALEQARRLSEANIPFVIVSGNHDAPRMRETGSIFRIFEGLPHVHPVYQGAYQRLRVGGLTVHAVPQAITQEAFQGQLAQAKTEGEGPHVLAVHGTVLGVDGLFSGEFNEYQIPLGMLRPDFDYIALGHFHNRKQVQPNAWYAGSTESFSFAESDQAKGFLEVKLGAKPVEVMPRPVATRPMIDLGSVAPTTDHEALRAEVARRLTQPPPGAIARVTIDGLDRATARLVDWDALREGRKDLLHVEVRVRTGDDAHALDGSFELHGLAAEFDAFFQRYPLPNEDRDRVRAAALECLTQSGGADRAG